MAAILNRFALINWFSLKAVQQRGSKFITWGLIRCINRATINLIIIIYWHSIYRIVFNCEKIVKIFNKSFIFKSFETYKKIFDIQIFNEIVDEINVFMENNFHYN
jgi:hypothetical protein